MVAAPGMGGGERRASFVVSGVKHGEDWELNAAGEELEEKMKEKGASGEEVEAVNKVAGGEEEKSNEL